MKKKILIDKTMFNVKKNKITKNKTFKNKSKNKKLVVVFKFLLTKNKPLLLKTKFNVNGEVKIKLVNRRGEEVGLLKSGYENFVSNPPKILFVLLVIEPNSSIDIEEFVSNTNVINYNPNYNKCETLFVSTLGNASKLNKKHTRIIISERSNLSYYSENEMILSYGKLREFLFDNQFNEIYVDDFNKKITQVFDSVYLKESKIIFEMLRKNSVVSSLFSDQTYFYNHFVKKYDSVIDFETVESLKRYLNKDNVLFIFDDKYIKQMLEKKYDIVIDRYVSNTGFNNIKLNKRAIKSIKNIAVLADYENNINNSVYKFINDINNKNEYNYNFYINNNYGHIILKPLMSRDNVRIYETKSLNEIVDENDLIILLGNNNVDTNYYIYNLTKNKIPFQIDSSIYNYNLSEKMKIVLGKKFEFKQVVNDTELEIVSYDKVGDLINIKPTNYKISKSELPILTIAIPSYKVAKFIKNGLDSILETKNIGDIEVLIINDGSPDDTLKVANEIVKYTNEFVKVINKPNGGHGSTINKGIECARGKYFKLMDGDDYFLTEELDKLIDYLKISKTDIVLTDLVEDFSQDEFKRYTNYYEFMEENTVYKLDEMIDETSFSSWGPLLSTATYRTEVLKEANFKHDEKCFYVDMEYNLINYIFSKDVVYLPLYVYNYYLGRADQSVSRESFMKNYSHHEKVCLRLLEEYKKYEHKLSESKKKYLINNILSPMCKLQYELAHSYFKERKKFVKFDNNMKKYNAFYYSNLFATKTTKFHRKTAGIFCFMTRTIKKVTGEI